jgi:uncharacterized damage-inducible protein DinB
MPRPDLNRVPVFYHNYIKLADSDDLVNSMKEQADSFRKFLDSIPDNVTDYRYAEGKWSIKELVQHCIDAERIFAYRSLCIARKDQTALPGFDEEAYAKNAKTENRNWQSLKEEFSVVRQSSVILFETFDEEQLEATGTASGNSNYVRAFGFILVGHLRHHENILRERYLNNY